MVIRRKNPIFLMLAVAYLALVGLILLSSTSAAWAATSRTIPIHAIRSADCTAELVEISGTIHLVSQTQADGSVVGHFNYQNVTAIGLDSGTVYQVAAVDNFYLSDPFPSSINSLRAFRLISQGSDSNLLVTALFHVTVNAAGEVTADIDTLDMLCT